MQRKLPNVNQYFTITSMHTNPFWVSIVIYLSLVTLPASDNNTSLPFISPIFGDNMVLQRGRLHTIWGWSKLGEVIRVEIAGHDAKAVTGADGRWQVKIQPPQPGPLHS